MEDAVTTQVTSTEWSHRHAIDQTTACQNKDKLSMSWFRPCLHESLCKTLKWHRVPVLSRRWWISVHHVEQAVIIQLTLKWSHSGIACSRDVLGHLKSYRISCDEAILSELKLLLARAGILYFFIVLRCVIKLCNRLSSWSASIMHLSSAS